MANSLLDYFTFSSFLITSIFKLSLLIYSTDGCSLFLACTVVLVMGISLLSFSKSSSNEAS